MTLLSAIVLNDQTTTKTLLYLIVAAEYFKKDKVKYHLQDYYSSQY